MPHWPGFQLEQLRSSAFLEHLLDFGVGSTNPRGAFHQVEEVEQQSSSGSQFLVPSDDLGSSHCLVPVLEGNVPVLRDPLAHLIRA